MLPSCKGFLFVEAREIGGVKASAAKELQVDSE